MQILLSACTYVVCNAAEFFFCLYRSYLALELSNIFCSLVRPTCTFALTLFGRCRQLIFLSFALTQIVNKHINKNNLILITLSI